MKMKMRFWIMLLVSSLMISACQPAAPTFQAVERKKVLAVESFIADLTRQVAGNRMQVDTLIPLGVDPHSFEITPSDVSKIAEADILVVNGNGLEGWLEETLQNSGSKAVVIICSQNLSFRTPSTAEAQSTSDADGHPPEEGDPHFWLNPLYAMDYVKQIRDGLIAADPEGRDGYTANAEAYNAQLADLDTWIKEQVDQIPVDRRLLVTNHESLGYYADRYGFKVIGAIIPSVTSESTPTAQDLVKLSEQIKKYQAPAIFLETGANPQLADQLAADLHIQVVTDLYTHSLSAADGPAPDYISMMKWNTTQIVEGLK